MASSESLSPVPLKLMVASENEDYLYFIRENVLHRKQQDTLVSFLARDTNYSDFE